MNKYIAEFIGTFFLVLTIGCTVMAGGTTGVIPPLAIGSALMVMVYAGGHVSGAHYNPAVTIGVWLRGRCSAADVGPYIGAQLAGARCRRLRGEVPATGLRGRRRIAANIPRALTAEALFTFALVYVVLNVATSKATQRQFVLRPGDWFYRAVRRVRGGRHFRRRLQSGGAVRHDAGRLVVVVQLRHAHHSPTSSARSPPRWRSRR